MSDPFDDLLASPTSKTTDSIDPFDALLASGNEQKSGALIDPNKIPSKIRELLPTKEQVPELVGSMAGGLARTTLPGMALASGGAAVGEGIRQAIFENKSLTPKERLMKILAAAGRGALGEVGGRAIGKIFSPFSSAVTPELKIGRQAAESVGIEAPISNLTESKTLQAAERGLEYTPFGQAITKQRQEALSGLKNYADTVGESIAPNKPADLVGNNAKQELEAFKQRYDEVKGKLYDIAMPSLKNAPVALDNTTNTLQNIIKRRAGTAEPAGLNQVREWLDDLLGKKIPSDILNKEGQPYTRTLSSTIKNFNELRKFRTNIGAKTKFNDPATSGLNADMRELYGAISNDLDNAASNASPQIASDLKKADEFFQMGKMTLKSKVYNAILNTNPENVYKVVFVPNSPSNLEMGKEILGNSFNDVTKQWFDSIVNKSTSPDGSISAAKLATQLKRYGSTIDKLTEDNPVLQENFDKLSKISALLTKGRETTQGSQTAYIGTLFGSVLSTIYNLFTNPSLAAKEAGLIGATGLGVVGIKSDIGRELLTRGYPRVGKAAERAAQLAAQLGLQKATQ